jgi:uncharacterized protein
VGHLSALHVITGNSSHQHRAERILAAFAGEARNNPFGYATLLKGHLELSDPIQLVLAGRADLAREGLAEAARLLSSDSILQLVASPEDLPPGSPARAKALPGRGLTAYLCRGSVCAAPADDRTSLEEAARLLGIALA